jgi:hypothetical protein
MLASAEQALGALAMLFGTYALFDGIVASTCCHPERRSIDLPVAQRGRFDVQLGAS